MIKNIFKVAFRIFRREKGFAAINIGGLALSLAACLLISIFIREELSYDRFHTKSDQIYRLGGSTVGWPYGNIILEEYPEVEAVVYMRTYPTFPIKTDRQFIFEDMKYADNDFFKVFDFPLIEGSPDQALSDPYSIVLSEKLAAKLFGDSHAFGQTVILGDSDSFKVTGVARIPERSHIRFDALLSFNTLKSMWGKGFDQEMTSGWLDLNVINYVLLRPGTDTEQFASKIRNLPQKHAGDILDQWGSNYQLDLEPLSRIYLYSDSGNWLGPKSSIAYVYLLICVGIFLLIIAAANFINLATARSLSRAKEVGVRKVVGSSRSLLIRQFLGESFMTCFLAVFIAVDAAILMLPLFNSLTERQYNTAQLFTLETVGVIVALFVVISLLAGIYPALSLSSFRPVSVLRGRFSSNRKGARLRQGLVITQFLITSILIIGTFVVMRQLRYMQNQELGFDSEQVIVMDARRAPGDILSRSHTVLKDTLENHADVKQVSSMGAVPGRNGWQGQISFPEGWPEGKSISLEYIPVHYGFEETLGLEVMAGRSFDPSFPTDEKTAVMINQTAVKEVGWASPAEAIGKGFSSPGSGKPDGVVIGVAEDYHHHGLQERIQPLMFGFRQVNPYFMLRVQNGKYGAVIHHVNEVWDQFFSGYPMNAFFLNESFARQYEQEKRLERIFLTFTFFTLLIASLGLFGLTTFATSQRVKEIGVRKVLGAKVRDIVWLLSTDFMKLVLIAYAAAVPIGYILMNQWLQSFAYRITLNPGIFLINALIVFSIAFLTVSVKTVKTALSDPSQSLRYE